MSTCLGACSGEITKMTLATCTPLLRPGGMRAFGVMKCDSEFSDVSGGTIQEADAWEAFINAGIIITSGYMVGSKAAASDTTLLVSSCLPEVPQGRSTAITLRDYNSAADLSDYAFYQALRNYAGFHFFYITCDELVYFYDVGTWVASPDDVRPETSTESVHFATTVTSNFNGIKVPVHVSGILGLL